MQFKTTNNREPLHRMKHSTHIRFLVFSKNKITSANVFINDVAIGKAHQSPKNQILYVLEWTPSSYLTGSHSIKVIVQV